MQVINSFWISVLEAIFLPIIDFYGFSPILTFVILVFVFALQVFIFWHLFLKPFIYIFKVFSSLITQRVLWKEPADEK